LLRPLLVLDTVAMPPSRSDANRSLLTVLFTDIVGSTQLVAQVGDDRWKQFLDAHDELVRAELKKHGGREVKSVGDGFLATFPSPTNAIACAKAVVEGAQSIGLEVRAGLHCGEIERRGRDLGGIGVHIAARVAGIARPNEILVTATVRDLVAGSQIPFASRGSHALRGVPGKRELFAAVTASTESAGSGPRRRAPRTRRTRPTPAVASSAADSISVLLVDDHPLWRRTLREVVEQDGAAVVVAEAADGEEAVRVAAATPTDVIVMDIDLPRLDGISATRAIVSADQHAKVLVLSGVKEPDQVLAAVRAGASGYLVKTAEPEEVADALRTVHGGGLAFPPELASIVLQELRSPSAPAPLPLRTAVAAARVLDREGLANVLAGAGLQVTASVNSAERLAAAMEDDVADVAVLDLDSGRAPHNIKTLLDRAATTGKGVLILSDSVDASTGDMFTQDKGGVGYLLKQRIHEAGELVDAVRRVAKGEPVLDRELVSRLLRGKPASSRSRVDELTDRERETLSLMAQGCSNPAVAEALHVSLKTVEGYVASVFSKLGLEQSASEHRRVMAVLAYLHDQG
jgi:DNA-binding NarL/FixJ family response regulator/class 3 adenylate cyclase